jgi:ATP-binding cassette subfamily C exporter for protease/lipase
MLLGRALAPIEQIVGSWRVLSEGLLAWRRLAPVMAQVAQQSAPMALPRPNGALLAQALSYRVGDRMLLTGVSLMLRPGEAMAVIGPSGAGKSTLIRLLIGLWAPSAGSVRLDGVEVSKWPRDQLGPHIGYLPQDVELFEGSIAENIARFGDVDAARVIEAARAAGLHETILRFPKGYDTRVGAEGGLLSGGQRQRIGLARALHGDPALVVLDEPNANLDDAGEAALLAAVQGCRERGRTVFLISHRPGIVDAADRLLVLREGRVQLEGPRDAVIAALKSAQPVLFQPQHPPPQPVLASSPS